MKNQNLKTALFFSLIFIAIVTVHILTPNVYK
jgi:hypothetical protein